MMVVCRTELALLRRHWGVWSAIVGSILLALSLDNCSGSQLPYWIDESVFRFFLFWPLLLTISAARRHRACRVDQIVGAWPYQPTTWVIGRFAANYLVWLLCSITGWVAAGLAVASRGWSVDVGLLAQHWAVTAPVSVLLVTAVGFALGSSRVHELAACVAAIACWVAAVAGAMADAPLRIYIDLLSPQRYLPLNAVGYFPNGVLMWAGWLFRLGLGVALIAAVWALVSRSRRQPTRSAGMVLVPALVVMVAGAVMSDATVSARGREQINAMARRNAGQVVETVPTPLVIDNYDLAATIAPDDHRLAVSGSFVVRNAGAESLSQFDLTLRGDFSVARLSRPDGTPVPFRRAGDVVEVPLALAPGESIRLAAEWAGEVWQWGPDPEAGWSYSGLTVIAHVAPESIYIPADYGWYPLPGRLALPAAGPDAYGPWWNPGRRLDVPPAVFTLAVAGTDLNVVTNAGGECAGLYLIGTALETVVRDGVALTTSPMSRDRAFELATELARRAALLGEVAPPADAIQRVVEMPQGTVDGMRMATELARTPGVVLVKTYEYTWGGSLYEWVSSLSARWWSAVGRSNWSVGRGLAGYMEFVVTGQQPAAVSEDEDGSVMQAMIIIDQAAGREVALTLLREMYAVGPDNLSMGRFMDSVDRIAAAEPQVREALLQMGGKQR